MSEKKIVIEIFKSELPNFIKGGVVAHVINPDWNLRIGDMVNWKCDTNYAGTARVTRVYYSRGRHMAKLVKSRTV